MSTPKDTWQELQRSAETAVKKSFPIEGRSRKLVLNSVEIDEKPAQSGDLRSQEKAKERGRTWGANVRADLSLVDKTTGKVIDRSKVKLMTLPKPTDRYSYIVDGSEWQVDNLWRLKSGVYSQVKNDGSMETEFNLAKPFAKYPRLKVPFDPKSRKFKLNWRSKNVPLYSVLKTLGVQDEDMKKAWGKEIYEANVSQKTEVNINEFYKRLEKEGVRAKGDTYDDKASAIVEEFNKTELYPETTQRTLGKPLKSVDGEALLLASKRVLDLARGNIPPDDRNSLVFKKLEGVENFMAERLERPATKRSIQSKVRNNIDRQDKIRSIVPGELFNKPVKKLFTSSTLSKNPEQTNPLEMISNNRATTILGGDEGGIKSERTLSRDMKLINPSHMGFLDPIHTPESSRTGISLNLPMGVVKDGETPKVLAYDLKKKKLRRGKDGVTPEELHTSYVLLPDQVTWKDGKPKPIAPKVKMKDPRSGEIVKRPFKDAGYAFVSPHQLFDEATNLIPFLQNNQGNRTMTASRQAAQSVGLKNREEPLVQVQGGPSTWEQIIGTPFTHTAPVNGVVESIKTDITDNEFPDSIILKDDSGKKHEVQLYNHFPLNEKKSFMNSEVAVKPGDKIRKGQVLADTNYTRNGKLALGSNIRVSYLPYKGYNFEDGIVISDSASKKLTSEHMHKKSVEIDPSKDRMSKKDFQVYASATSKKFNKEQLNKLDDDGVVRVGQKVDPGDLLIAAVGKKDNLGAVSRMASRLDRRLFEYQDRSSKWDSEYPGTVVKVNKSPNGKGATVFVRTDEPAQVGDKIVGRHGNKSIITQIVDDKEMPRIGNADGEHVEMLMNPSGVPSRINLGQMLETAASKVARKTGKPYVVNNFGGVDKDYTDEVKKALKENNLSDTETIFDPTTKKELGKALTGDQYIMKLKHQVEKKLSVRGAGAGLSYTLDRSPKGTGAASPGQGVGQLEFYSLLAHGARKNLQEMATYKSDQQLDENLNPQSHLEFWRRVQMGQPLPAPKPSFAFKKFESYLKGLGVDTVKKGNEMQLVPLTDKGILALSNGEIKDPGRVLRGKDAKELERGLFDPKVTGGLPDPNEPGKGLKWSHIALAEPLPNPVFVGTAQKPGPAVVLSGMKFQDFEDVVVGKKKINGETGGKVIAGILDNININKELEDLNKKLPNLKGANLNHAHRRARYLKALKELKDQKLIDKPSDAYIMNNVPVLPPVFRPIVPMHDGSLMFDDVNHFYKDLGIVNNKLKEGMKELPEEEAELRAEAYDLLKATMGTGGVPKYDSNRPLKGILDTIAGTNPKQGFFQKRLMKRRQDLSMRSTIIPEPSMHLDRVGVPRTAALELYKPFVIGELKRTGRSLVQAHKDVKEENPAAWIALEKAMDKRPVLLKRDPALHKFSFMSFKPQLVDGKAIRIHPLVTAGFNADFDGDTMSAFVPLTDEAAREAEKMFPSNNLFSSTNAGIMYSPTQESLLGLNLLSEWGKDSGKKFTGMDQVKRAYNKGSITPTDVITVNGKKTTYGRMMVADSLPKNYEKKDTILHDPNVSLVKRGNGKDRLGVSDILTDIAKQEPKKFAKTVDGLKDLGNKFSYEMGFSIGLDDLGPNKKVRDNILTKYDAQADKILGLSSLKPDEKDAKVIDLYTKATKDLEKALKPEIAASGNNLFRMVDSGARGKWSQFRQMNIAPMLMQDAVGKTIPNPVRKSYSEGLDVGDYWTALHGARMGTLQRAEGTQEPGALTKDIMNFIMPEMVVSKDCKTKDGISMKITEDDVQDRFLAKDINVGGRTFKEGTVVTPDVTSHLRRHRVDKVVVRSPLKCNHGRGMCAKCFGLNEDGKEHEIGTNIGVLAGHSMGEPAMQLAMDCNAAGNLVTVRYERRVETVSFEDLWHKVHSYVDVDGDVETKVPEGLEIWDHDQFVPMELLQRHKPHSPMALVRLDSGHSFVCQTTHPNWARRVVISCPQCESQGPVGFVTHNEKRDETRVVCSSCDHRFNIHTDSYESQQEEIVRTQDLEGWYLPTSKPEAGGGALPEGMLPPYSLGLYLAEGNVRRQRTTTSAREGSKRRQTSPAGLRWSIKGVCITQNPGPVKDRLHEDLAYAGLEYSNPTDKVSQINNVKLARVLWTHCGIQSENKRLPLGWESQDDLWMSTVLAGLIDGDGTVSEGRLFLDTTSWFLTSQVQELVRRLGGASRVYATTNKELTCNQGYRVEMFLPFKLHGVKDTPSSTSTLPSSTYSKVVQVKEVLYDGWTYDVATTTRGFSANGVRTHNSFHTGGVAGSRGAGASSRMDRLKQLLNLPESVPNSATLATASGKVEKIERDKATQGWNITVSGKKHFAPAQNKPMYKGKDLAVGASVSRGDPLTDGPINPRELLPLSDVPTVQNHLVGELYDGIYRDERVRRRNIETVVRSLTNLSRVKDPGDNPDYTSGDYALRTVIEEQNKNLPKGGKPTEYYPVLKGMAQNTLDQNEDWMARLNFRRLKESIMEGAAKGWKTDLHGTSPIPAYAYGAEFGEPAKGKKPWEY